MEETAVDVASQASNNSALIGGGMLFGGAAVTGLIVACWSKIKMLLSRMVSYVFVTVSLESELSIAISLYCWENLKRSPFGNRTYDADRTHVRPLRRRQVIAFETIGKEPVVFWKGWRPIFLGQPQRGDDGNNGGKDSSITFIRGMWNMDQLIIDAIDLYNKRCDRGNRKTRFRVQRYYGEGSLRARRRGRNGDNSFPDAISTAEESLTLGDKRILKWEPEQIGPEIEETGNALQYLAFPNHINEIIKELRHWLDSEQWYRKKHIPWRRGWLIFGPPGSGKTSLTRAIAEDFDLPVFVFDLASMNNEEFTRYWHRLDSHSPCIALIEDIDGVFQGRRNVLGEDGGGLTFDCLLNNLGGIEVANGVFVVITTNNIDAVDDAVGRPTEGTDISTRPGRIDRALELTLMTEDCRLRLAERILADCRELIRQIVDEGEGDTPAQFQERCAQAALAAHWQAQDVSHVVTIEQEAEAWQR